MAPADRVWPPMEWALLGTAQIDRRVRAEFCEHCGAVECQPCMSKNKTTLFNYTHHARRQAAVKRFIAEQHV